MESKVQAGEAELAAAASQAAATETTVTYTGKGALGIDFLWPTIEALSANGLASRYPMGQVRSPTPPFTCPFLALSPLLFSVSVVYFVDISPISYMFSFFGFPFHGMSSRAFIGNVT